MVGMCRKKIDILRVIWLHFCDPKVVANFSVNNFLDEHFGNPLGQSVGAWGKKVAMRVFQDIDPWRSAICILQDARVEAFGIWVPHVFRPQS